MTPADSLFEKYIYIYSFIYLFLPLRMPCGYFLTASFVSITSSFAFYHRRSDNFFCQRDADGTSHFSSQSVVGHKYVRGVTTTIYIC